MLDAKNWEALEILIKTSNIVGDIEANIQKIEAVRTNDHVI